ncbi:galactose-binding like protein [Russula earlei]|uniref:Galactose-binding like protein n=1 Tax=Russula earlei TaxID=71964 RepID=A0ACC0UP76_9AGAM|nr:galactose-binding like protein [Russula earlei]
MLTRLITTDTRIKVSSTLDSSLGKSCLVDGSPETCWTSQQAHIIQGLPQYIQLSFSSPVTPRRISLTFQGGFVGTTCVVITRSQDATSWQELTRIYPEDVNRAQIFDLTAGEPLKGMKLVFEESSDFFGRITVYDLMIEGEV